MQRTPTMHWDSSITSAIVFDIYSIVCPLFCSFVVISDRCADFTDSNPNLK